jgi:transcriptional regulator with XRE-family HTH domain
MATESPELSDSQSRSVAATIREHLARRRISRQRLADDARISVSTLEKALGGSRPFTLGTIVRLEEALGISLRPKSEREQPDQDSAFAPASLGAYAHPAVRWLEGNYLTLRPSFEVKGAIYAYRTEIAWNADAACLVFREAERLDAPFAQKGVVSLPNKSGHIYLHTNEDGQMRLAILARPLISGEIYGVLATLASGSGNHLSPAAAPLALIPLAASAKPELGRITDKSGSYAAYRKHLDHALAPDFVRLVGL